MLIVVVRMMDEDADAAIVGAADACTDVGGVAARADERCRGDLWDEDEVAGGIGRDGAG